MGRQRAAVLGQSRKLRRLHRPAETARQGDGTGSAGRRTVGALLFTLVAECISNSPLLSSFFCHFHCMSLFLFSYHTLISLCTCMAAILTAYVRFVD